MRKLLSLVLAFAMILGLFAFPVSADESMYQAVGQELMNYGVLKGVDAQGTLKEMDKLTREESLVVLSRLMGQEDKAMATEAVADFTDVPATHWAAKYVAYAKLQGWTTGVSEKEFGLGQQVTTQQVVTFMMRALGYKEVKWEEAMTKAKELGLLEGVSAMAEDQIIRGEVFIVMKNTLYTKPMNEKQELIYKLGLKENPVPETLEVVDVKADNLLEVVVEFNQEVDKDSFKNAFRFVGANQGELTPELQEDGKTVVVALGTALKNLKMYKFQVSDVKALNGMKMEKVVKEFTAVDKTEPEVKEVKVTGPKNFQLIFSEPIKIETTGAEKSMLTLYVDGKKSFTLSPAPNADNRVVDVKTSTLKDGTTYTVRVEKFKDYAGYINKIENIEFPYASVKEAPTAEVVKATQEYVEFKFDRPVKNLTKDNFYHTYSSWKAVGLFKDVATMNKTVAAGTYDGSAGLDEYVDKVVVRFVKNVNNLQPQDHPLQAGDVEVNILGLNNHKKVVDRWNNAMSDVRLMASVTADKEAPVVESVEVTGENTVEVKFSKAVNAKTNQNNFELLKEDGSKISGLVFKTEIDKMTVKLTITNPDLVGKTVVLNIKDVKDNTINLNKMASVESQTITFGDKTFEGITEASYKNFSTDKLVKIRLKFKEAIDTTAGAEGKNYKFMKGSKVLDLTLEPTILTDKIVEFVFDHDTWVEKVQQEAKGTVVKYVPLNISMSNAVTDAVGNKISGFEQTIGLVNGSVPPTIKSVNAVANNKIEVTFSETVVVDGGFEAEKFAVGTKKPYSADHEADKVVLEFDENNLLPSDPEASALTLSYNGTTIQSETGGDLAFGTPAIKDKIAPAYVSLPSESTNKFYTNAAAAGQYGDLGFKYDSELTFGEPAVLARWNDTAKRYEVVVVYTEAIDKNTIQSTTTYSVNGWAITEVPMLEGTRNNVVIIPLAFNKLEEVMFQNITLTQNTSIKDIKGNVLAKSEAPVVIQEKMKTAEFNMTSGTANAKASLVTLVASFDKYKVSTAVDDFTPANAAQHATESKVYHLKTKAEEFTAFKNALTEADKVSVKAEATLAEIKKAEKELNDAFAAFKPYTRNLAPTLSSSPTLVAGDKEGYVKINNRGAANYYILDGKHFYEDNENIESLSLKVPITDNLQFEAHKGDKVDFIGINTFGNVTSYTVITIEEGQIGKGADVPSNLLIASADSDSFTAGVNGNLMSGRVEVGTFASGEKAFKISFVQADETEQTVLVEVTGDNLDKSGSNINGEKFSQTLTSGQKTADIKVTQTGTLTVKCKVMQQGRISLKLEADVIVK